MHMKVRWILLPLLSVILLTTCPSPARSQNCGSASTDTQQHLVSASSTTQETFDLSYFVNGNWFDYGDVVAYGGPTYPYTNCKGVGAVSTQAYPVVTWKFSSESAAGVVFALTRSQYKLTGPMCNCTDIFPDGYGSLTPAPATALTGTFTYTNC